METNDLERMHRIHQMARARAHELRQEALDRAWQRAGALLSRALGLARRRSATPAGAVPLPEHARLHRRTA